MGPTHAVKELDKYMCAGGGEGGGGREGGGGKEGEREGGKK